MTLRLCILAMTLAAASLPAAADRVLVTGTRVLLEPPPGFSQSTEFPGLVDSTTRSVIMVSEVPAPFHELSQSYSNHGLRIKGLRILSRESLEHDGLRAELIHGTQRVGRIDVVKWIMITGDANESVALTATYPGEKHGRLGPTVEASLRGAVWESSRSLNHFDGLDFTLREVPQLRIASRINNTIIFTRGGRLPDKYYTGPLLVVGWADYADGAPEDRRTFAREQFAGISLLENSVVDDLETLPIANLPGVEIMGSGKHRYLGYPVSVLQAVVFEDERFVLAQGFTEAKNREEHFDLFRTIVGTFRTTH